MKNDLGTSINYFREANGSYPVASEHLLAERGGSRSLCSCRRMASAVTVDMCINIFRLGLMIMGFANVSYSVSKLIPSETYVAEVPLYNYSSTLSKMSLGIGQWQL